MSHNPYSPPQSAIDEVASKDAPALWNPNAAINLSILFSPAFGAYLHMRNWEALGEPSKAANSKVWMIVTLALLVCGIFLAAFMPESGLGGGLNRFGGIVLLLSWYFASARSQTKYVEEQFGKQYPHKGWTKPVLIAIGAFIGVIIVAVILGVVGAMLHA